jgi:hypothetical protein
MLLNATFTVNIFPFPAISVVCKLGAFSVTVAVLVVSEKEN